MKRFKIIRARFRRWRYCLNQMFVKRMPVRTVTVRRGFFNVLYLGTDNGKIFYCDEATKAEVELMLSYMEHGPNDSIDRN